MSCGDPNSNHGNTTGNHGNTTGKHDAGGEDRKEVLKKALSWRGNMVQMLLGRKENDPTQDQFRNGTKNAKLVKINCAGEMFVTTETSLSRYPDTLLGNPARRAEYLDTSTGYLYFDRHQELFSAILYFYQSPGTFRPPETIDPVVVEEELDFFDIDLARMIENYEAEEAAKNVPVPPTLTQRINQTITDPSYSKFSMVWGGIDLLCILTTISMLVIETIPEYSKHFDDPFSTPLVPYKLLIYGIDVFINLFFSLDLLIRFSTWPHKRRFFAKPLNIMDLLAVAPFYVELVVFITTRGLPPPQFFALKVLRICRVVRVVRVLKIVRHSTQLTEVMGVVSSAKQEFVVLIGVVAVVILLVGTIMYFIEFNVSKEELLSGNIVLDSSGFNSILHGCWWAVVTVTTVGYGDLYPKTMVGRLAGSLVVLFGIVVIAFPMTIIISKFQDSFTIKKLNANKEMTRKLRHMAVCRPYDGGVKMSSEGNGVNNVAASEGDGVNKKTGAGNGVNNVSTEGNSVKKNNVKERGDRPRQLPRLPYNGLTDKHDT